MGTMSSSSAPNGSDTQNLQAVNPATEKVGVPNHEDAPSPCVYFLASPDRTTVKIGKSRQLATRLRDIQSVNPFPVVLLAAVEGHTQVEKWFHRKWKEHRLHNEWFTLAPEIAEFIAEAANDNLITRRTCPGVWRMDQPAPPRPEPPEPELRWLGDEDEVLRVWRAAGGYEIGEVGQVDFATFGRWSASEIREATGTWIRPSGTPYLSSYVGILRIAHQLAKFEDRDERTLAFIQAASLDANQKLNGPHRTCLAGLLERRIELGMAKHALPLDFHYCDRCSVWYDRPAIDEVAWLERLAHVSRVDDLRLVRIVNNPNAWEDR